MDDGMAARPDRAEAVLLRPLLDYLAGAGLAGAATWGPWQIRPVEGGANNLVYRATTARCDVAVKFTIRDGRDRAGREYAALQALARVDSTLAPCPLLLDRERYLHPVVVQSWLDGAVSAAPPATDAEWAALLQHLAAIHRVVPGQVGPDLRPAVLSMTSAHDGRQRIADQLALIPLDAQPASLRALVRAVAHTTFPAWPTPPLALCRCDPNTLNFIRRPAGWASVDWENSGWGDPAFEIADLMTHPQYLAVPAARWDWALATYTRLGGAATVAERVPSYYGLTLVWWVARLARSLHEIAQGREQARLAAPPAGRQADAQAKYAQYVARASAAFP